MALARVGVISGVNTTFASTVTTNSRTTTTGNILIAIMEADTVAANGCTVTDSKGNAWTRVLSNSAVGTFDFEIWFSVLTTGGTLHTVTCADNGGGVDSTLIVEEWSGQAASPLDKSTSAQDIGGLSTAPNSGATAATVQNNEVVIGGTCVAGAPTLTLGAGYTNLTRVATTFTSLGFESQVVATTGAQTATFTAGVAGSWVCGVATFKEAGGVVTVVPNLSLLGAGS